MDRIEKLYDRWSRGDTDEDDVHVAIDELLYRARLIAPGAGDAVAAAMDDDGIDDKRIAVLNVLADIAGIEPDYNGPWHVVAYQVTREFGGPEEGGWYYDWYASPKLIATFPDDESSAFQTCRWLNEEAKATQKAEGRPQGLSVLGGTDIVYSVDKVVGESETKEAPHYE